MSDTSYDLVVPDEPEALSIAQDSKGYVWQKIGIFWYSTRPDGLIGSAIPASYFVKHPDEYAGVGTVKKKTWRSLLAAYGPMTMVRHGAGQVDDSTTSAQEAQADSDEPPRYWRFYAEWVFPTLDDAMSMSDRVKQMEPAPQSTICDPRATAKITHDEVMARYPDYEDVTGDDATVTAG